MRNECNCDPLGFGGHDENCPRAGKSEGIPTRLAAQPVADGLTVAISHQREAMAQAAQKPAPDVTDALGQLIEAVEGAGCEPNSDSMNPCEQALFHAKAALTAPAPDVTDAMVEAVNVLAQAEAHCRNCHDYYGGGHNKTSRAWDKMRKAVDRLRQLLTDNEAALSAQSKPAPQPALTDAQSVRVAWSRCRLISNSHKQLDLSVSVANSDDMSVLVQALAAQDGSA